MHRGGSRLPADCGAGCSPSGHRAKDGARSDFCRAMRLRECVDALDGMTMQGSLDREITGLTDDSRRVSPGGLFVAVKGTQSDGHRFLAQAVAAGAGAIVVEKGQVSAEALAALGIPVLQVGDSRRALGLLASRFYGDPARRLKVDRKST